LYFKINAFGNELGTPDYESRSTSNLYRVSIRETRNPLTPEGDTENRWNQRVNLRYKVTVNTVKMSLLKKTSDSEAAKGGKNRQKEKAPGGA